MGISTSDWQIFADDVNAVLQDVDQGINVAVALGVPVPPALVPVAALAAGIAAKLDALSKGNLSLIQAEVESADAAAAAAIAAKFPDG